MIGYYNYTVVATYASLLASVFGMHFALSGNPLWAIYCLMVSGMLDAFDGKIARTRERSTDEMRFGIQIDSLCDTVAFAILPAVIAYSLGMNRVWYVLVLFVYILAAVIRLGYFNVNEENRQSETTEVRREYRGLPVTTVSLIFPAFFALKLFIPHFWYMLVLTAFFALMAIAFVSRIRIRKPGLAGIIALVAFGAFEFAAIVFITFNTMQNVAQ